MRPERTLPVLGPPDFVDHLGLPLRAQLDTDDPVIEPRELSDGLEARFGEVTLTARAVEHGDLACFGVRLEGGSESFAYSADTGPCAVLTHLALEPAEALRRARGGIDVAHDGAVL